MGMRTQCAQCHNHPFDRWTMDDYYSFAAFFSQIGRKQGEDYRETIVFNSGGGEVTHPVGGRVMPPKFLGGAAPDVAGKDRREVLAEWLASPENPYFATSVANRVWAHFFGKGIVEPVDDVRVSNPASNPELFDDAGQEVHRVQVRLQAAGARHLQLAGLPALDAAQRQQRGRRSELRPRQHPPHSGREAARLHQPGDRDQGQVPGPAARRRAVQIADGQTQQLLPDHLRPVAAQTACARAKSRPSRRCRKPCTCSTATRSTRKIGESKRLQSSARRRTKRRPQVIEALYIRCLSRKPSARGNAEARGRCWPPSPTPAVASKTSSGPC